MALSGEAALEAWLVRGPECADSFLKGQQAAADDLRIPSVLPAGSALGLHGRTSTLHRREYIRDPSALVFVWGGLSKRVQRPRQVIRPALDVGPSSV